MSGGVNQALACYYTARNEVVGITMKAWDYTNSGGSNKETGCCSLIL